LMFNAILLGHSNLSKGREKIYIVPSK